MPVPVIDHDQAAPRVDGAKIWLLIAASAVAVVLARLPLRDWLPHWFWIPTSTPLPLWWLFVPLVAAAVGCAVWLERARPGARSALPVLMALCFVLQMGFGWMEGRGLHGVRDHVLLAGHSGFAEAAVAQESFVRVARDYRELVTLGELDAYPHATKPPGQLLVYMATERLALLLSPDDTQRLGRFATLAALLWPALAACTILPLYALSRLAFDPARAFVPCLLYACVPSVVLITAHLDQCLYPLLATTVLALAGWGLRARSALLFTAAGAVTAVALFVSFSLVVLGPLLLAWLGIWVWRGPPERPRSELARQGAVALVAFVGGLAAVHGLLWTLFRYDSVTSYRFAMSAHQSHKIQDWTLGTIAYVAALDLVEFALWCGGAVTVLAMVGLVAQAGSLRAPRAAGTAETETTARTLAAAFAVVLLALAVGGKTVAETARLWLFLMPVVAWLAAVGLDAWFGASGPRALRWVVGLQLAVVFVFKLVQDFV